VISPEQSTQPKKPVNLALWGAIAFGLFIAYTWIHSWIWPEPPPKPYQPPPASSTTEPRRAIDCDDPFMDPDEWYFRCGGDGVIEPEPQDGPMHRYG
jgi:hypothetical protein